MKIAYFTHSLASCWNHGNAHFVRGVLSELGHQGHEIAAFEPEGSWSLDNLLRDHGPSGLCDYRSAYPDLSSRSFAANADVEALLDGADLVIVHEWNAPALIARIAHVRKRGGRFILLFHDTHHRAVSAPDEMRGIDLDGFDGILAFGEALAQVYRGWGWRDRVFVWHEAADVRRFHPPVQPGTRKGLVWIGNWGDGERSEELRTFLLKPAREAGMSLDIHGVRYPEEALDMLAHYSARYRGWLPNAAAPAAYARHLATVHVPRRFYAQALPGIPTIRVFEALACGIPLVSTPWNDCEELFRLGDFLMAEDGAAMTRQLRRVRDDDGLRAELAANGLETIRARHTCGHRATELLAIRDRLTARAGVSAARMGSVA